MGCDFQILGRQPDIHIQERCIRFLENVMLEFGKTKDDLYTLIDSETPIPRGTKIIRKPEFIFRPPGHLSDLSSDYSMSSSYIDGNLYGIIFIHKSIDPLHVVFDRESDGLLCSVNANLINLEHLYTTDINCSINKNEKDSDVQSVRLCLLPGSSLRIPTGTLDLYVIAHAILTLFIPNMKINADYDIDLCNNIFREIQFDDKLFNAKEEDLSKVVVETINHTQKIYDDLCEKQMKQKSKL